MTSPHDDMGYETPEETPAEFSLTPIASPTKYTQENTDILTEFILKATGYVDIINRNMLAMENVDYNDSFRFQDIISTAEHNLNSLKGRAINSIELHKYVVKKFKNENLASFLNDIITTMKKESRDLMDEAREEGAKAAEKSWETEHRRRKLSAEHKLKKSTKSSNDHRDPTPTCATPCVVQLRL